MEILSSINHFVISACGDDGDGELPVPRRMYHRIFIEKPTSKHSAPTAPGHGLYLASFDDASHNAVAAVYFSDAVFLELMQCHVTLAESAMTCKNVRLPRALCEKITGGDMGTRRESLKELLSLTMVKQSEHTEATASGVCFFTKFKSVYSVGSAAGVTVRDLAGLAGMSVAHFSRRFSAEVGFGPSLYLRELRLAYARRLLIQTDSPLVDIAMECGFSDQPHFTRVFKTRFGITPANYRNFFAFSPK